MKKCANCGQQLPRGSKFCEYCGASLKKPKHGGNKVATIILLCMVILFASSTAVFGFLYMDSIQTTREATKKADQLVAEMDSVQEDYGDALLDLATANRTVKEQDKEISRLEDEVDEYLFKAIFLDISIGIITDLNSGEYHSYDCLEFQNADTYWAHNIEYCEHLGYSPCDRCH